MESKKGIQLSVNFIVTFILAIVLFGMGIMFARMIMGGGTELSEKTYDQFDKKIGELACSRGEHVCIAGNSKTIERESVDVFPVTIKNSLPDRLDFQMKVELSRAFTKDNSKIDESKRKIEWMPEEDVFVLEPGEEATRPILVKPLGGTLPGRYSFDVEVFSKKPDEDENKFQPYPDKGVKKFYVTVE